MVFVGQVWKCHLPLLLSFLYPNHRSWLHLDTRVAGKQNSGWSVATIVHYGRKAKAIAKNYLPETYDLFLCVLGLSFF